MSDPKWDRLVDVFGKLDATLEAMVRENAEDHRKTRAAIAELRTEVSGLRAEVKGLGGNVGEANAAMGRLHSRFDELETVVGNHALGSRDLARVAAEERKKLAERVDRIEHRKDANGHPTHS